MKESVRWNLSLKASKKTIWIVKDFNRDTAWFRILDYEWPSVKQNLEDMLYGDER